MFFYCYALLQISSKIYIVQGLLQWILLVSWLGSVERKTFKSLFNSLLKSLKGIFSLLQSAIFVTDCRVHMVIFIFSP